MSTCAATRTSDTGHRLQGPCTGEHGHDGPHGTADGWWTDRNSAYTPCLPDFAYVHPAGHDGPHHDLSGATP